MTEHEILSPQESRSGEDLGAHFGAGAADAPLPRAPSCFIYCGVYSPGRPFIPVHTGTSSSLCSRNVGDRLKVTEPSMGLAGRFQLSRKASKSHTPPSQIWNFLCLL